MTTIVKFSETTGQPPVILLGTSHRATTIEQRERLALSPLALEALRCALKNSSAIAESFVLQTCNRFEITVIGRHGDPSPVVRELLLLHHNISPEELNQLFFEKRGSAVLSHLMEVCSGLDSQLIGETEIHGQMKEAYQRAQEFGSLGPCLHRILQKSFQAAKWIRTHTGVGYGMVSLGNVAVDLAQRIFGEEQLRSLRVLVVGSGQVGRDTARAFAARGSRHPIVLTSRDPLKAAALAGEIAGETRPFACWPQTLHTFDCVIFCTAAPTALMEAGPVTAAMRQRPARPLFLLDLAVPRDVAPEAGELDNVFLFTFADLAEHANRNRKGRHSEVEGARQALAEKAANLWKSLQSRNLQAADMRHSG